MFIGTIQLFMWLLQLKQYWLNSELNQIMKTYEFPWFRLFDHLFDFLKKKTRCYIFKKKKKEINGYIFQCCQNK